ncbi:hypothetical protein RIF29_29591 [Crotalaria pallida]|uniref:Uncharacterized protein n=1 Tax=Crotalaria pallida TaxID=3830 RepID=A0AAN9EH64_CROPI
MKDSTKDLAGTPESNVSSSNPKPTYASKLMSIEGYQPADSEIIKMVTEELCMDLQIDDFPPERDRCPEVIAPYVTSLEVTSMVDGASLRPTTVGESSTGATTVTKSPSMKKVNANNGKDETLGSNEDSSKNEELFGAWMLSKPSLLAFGLWAQWETEWGVPKSSTKNSKSGPKAQPISKPSKASVAGPKQRGSQPQVVTLGKQQQVSIEDASSDRTTALANKKLREEEVLRLMKYKEKQMRSALIDPYWVHYSLGEMDFLQRQLARGKGIADVTLLVKGRR